MHICVVLKKTTTLYLKSSTTQTLKTFPPLSGIDQLYVFVLLSLSVKSNYCWWRLSDEPFYTDVAITPQVSFQWYPHLAGQ